MIEESTLRNAITVEQYSHNHFNKRLLAARAEVDRTRFEQLVLDSVNNVATDKVHRLCSSNRAFVSKTLREAI